MGCGGSTENNARKKIAKNIEKKLETDQTKDKKIKKLLFLGAGESGKSTLFKQLVTIYGTGWSEDARREYISIIHDNIIETIQTLLVESVKYGQVDESNAGAADFMDELLGTEQIDADMGTMIKALWSDAGIQKTYSQRSNFQLTDSAKYFFDDIDRIAAADYLPSEQDIFRARVRTTGIIEGEFTIENNVFRIFDVGGQRTERRKWIHCFESVTAVLFVAALSSYDQVLIEDSSQNRMQESLSLFEDICNSRWFKNTTMMLFLNKSDLFKEKIETSPLSGCFEDYEGGTDYDAGVEFIRKKYKALNRWEGKKVYYHITCATDTSSVHAIFKGVSQRIILLSLKQVGLL